MGNLSKPQLLNKIVEAVYDSGWNVLFVSRTHPFKINIYNQSERHLLKIYIWNLSHGGGYMRPQDEYRIQPKVDKLETEIGWITLLLGWWEEGGVFAGFDTGKHEAPAWSASIQIKEEALRAAYFNGFSTSDKGNEEIAIAFRKDFFVEYVKNLNSLHDFGRFSEDRQVLDHVVSNLAVNDDQITITNNERKQVVVSVRKKLRDVSFQDRVLTAYNFRCAVCGLQLKLVQAAHIVPASHENGTDETKNGLALCALHHLAYDRSLITVTDNYSVILNSRRIEDLGQKHLLEGLDTFRNNLREMIILPPEYSQRPHAEYIRLANKIRGWNA
jgi:putative restriction endonuclease